MAARTEKDLEAQIQAAREERESEAAAAAAAPSEGDVGFGATGGYNNGDLYGASSEYNTSIGVGGSSAMDQEDDQQHRGTGSRKQYGASAAIMEEANNAAPEEDLFADTRASTIADRESEYHARRRNRIISPERVDPYADDDGGMTPAGSGAARSYGDVMQDKALDHERAHVLRNIKKKADGEYEEGDGDGAAAAAAAAAAPTADGAAAGAGAGSAASAAASSWDGAATPAVGSGGTDAWGATPAASSGKKSRWDSATPSTRKRNRWDDGGATPAASSDGGGASGWGATPAHAGAATDETPTTKKRSRWDATPSASDQKVASGDATPMGMGAFGVTPVGSAAMGMETPMGAGAGGVGGGGMTTEDVQNARWESDIDERNRPMSDEELDAIFPKEGYIVLDPPTGYEPIQTPGRRLLSTPTPAGGATGFLIQETEEGLEDKSKYGVQLKEMGDNLPGLKPEDEQHFAKLLDDVDEADLDAEELKERKIMKLLLKIKNGTPPMRKNALRQITDKARSFGAGPLFNQILPLLMSPALEDQERHLLVKVIDRVLYKLDDLVRPFVHKILVVIEPLLIDEDYYARVEGREIISNLAKAAGLATMISTMRPDIDDLDEYVRNTTARAFAVVASALGIPALLPFLKAVCRSKKSWQARHTGIKICQQIAILMGCAILPHLKSLVEIIEKGLTDEQQKVRTICALSLAALAEAATPYGIESFDSVLEPLWRGIRQYKNKGLAAFLKAIGQIIPLMDAEYAHYYTREVIPILIREFASPDEEMKKIVLKVVKQCCSTDGVEPAYIKAEILPNYFKHFWTQRMALDRRNYKQLVETTVEIANKVGADVIVEQIVEDLKDEQEQYRKMVMETIEKTLSNLGASEITPELEERLVDGILYAFQEQTSEDVVMLNGFGTVVNALGVRAKPYIPQICGTVLWRLNNKAAKVRQQAADLISRIAVVMMKCGQEKYMDHIGKILHENLGEEYPEVLGSIIGALKAIVNVVGMTKMQPPIKDLLPRLTPILKNRHEKVQENTIDLIGRIADRGSELVSAREWMRICFELLELLKAHKKAIRRATVNTFGYIAKAIGPQDVLATLLNNLKVQERQNRVCTTVAIAIVAETCSPFTVLPGLMNEYRVPELNVQNGVLKSLSFLFEYIGEMAKDYIYAVTPLLADALMDRDAVHRQTACVAIKHMSLGVFGFGNEDALIHLLNLVWPNIFEQSPHVINAVMDAIGGLSVALGRQKVMQYTLQGMFHPARKVREVYWKIYNTLYISAQDALLPAYPPIPDDENNCYTRTELYYVL